MEKRTFKHITPPLRLFCGPDSLKQIGRELDRVNSQRALIFCGSTLGRPGSPLDLVRSAMGDRCAGVFKGVRAHSPLPAVEAGAQEIKRLQADAVIAVGGGSAQVTARSANILAAENGDIRSLCTSMDERGKLKTPRLLSPKLPSLVVPTTPSPGPVRAGGAVFDPVGRKRLALFDPKTRAQSIFIHPELVKSAPRALVLSASLNTFAMAIEGLMSRSGDQISDALLMQALRLLALHLPNQALHDDPSVRDDLMFAGLLCGQGTEYTAAGITTVLGHAVGIHYDDVENGTSNPIVLPHGIRFNAGFARPGILKIATSLGLLLSEDEALLTKVIHAVEAIFGQLGIPRRLRDVGVTREVLSDIATSAMDDWFLSTNPRPVRDISEVRQVLEEAW